MADVDVPGLGPMNENLVYGGVGAVALYVAYRWYKAKSSPPAAAGDLSGTGSPDGTGLGAPGVGAPSATSYSNPAPGRLGGASAGTSTNGSAPATDQAWTAAVVSDLQNLGYNPQAVAGALAAYLSSQPLTADQVTIIRQAWAFEGRPPGNPGLNIVQGGTTPVPSGTIPTSNDRPTTISVGKGHRVTEVIAYAHSHGLPNYSWADFWEYNPGIAAQLNYDPGTGDWLFNGWNTTVTLSRPGAFQSGLGASSFDPAVPATS